LAGADAITIGSVRLVLIGAGRLLAWELSGTVHGLTKTQRAEVAVAFWQRVRMGRGSVLDVFAVLFPVRDGGTRRGGSRDGVIYVHHD
jgi:hypothetical protein